MQVSLLLLAVGRGWRRQCGVSHEGQLATMLVGMNYSYLGAESQKGIPMSNIEKRTISLLHDSAHTP